MVGQQILEQLRIEFSKQENDTIAKEQQAYMKSKMPFWGLKTPQRKKIYLAIFRQFPPQNNSDYRDTIKYIFNNATHRDEWYAGFSYAIRFKKYITEGNVDLYIALVRQTQWWDLVDGIATNLVGPALLDSNKLFNNLNSWIVDKNKWVRRTAILTQLKYKDKLDFKLLSSLIEKTWHEKEFFIRKAIGWALRQHSYTKPNDIIEFITNNKLHLSNLSKTEGLKALKRKGIVE